MTRLRSAAFVALIAVVIVGSESGSRAGQAPIGQTRVAAEPLSAVDTLLDTFRWHSVVGLGDASSNEQVHAFRLALIRDPRFPGLVNDIVVEWGNSLYQKEIDRYVSGESSRDPVRRLLEDSTAGPGWDTPVYEEFFRAVRAVNRALPRERRIRVLLGQPPIDWAHVNSAADLQAAQQDRDAFAAGLIQREVLANRRRALVAFGYGHLTRSYPAPRATTAPGARLASPLPLPPRLEHPGGLRPFTVYPLTRFNRDVVTLQASIASWPVPSLARIKGTTIGAASIRFFFPTLPPEQSDTDPAFNASLTEDHFDAVLYLGSPSTMTLSSLAPERCRDRRYMSMRAKRLSFVPLVQPPTGPSPLEQLQLYCASLPR